MLPEVRMVRVLDAISSHSPIRVYVFISITDVILLKSDSLRFDYGRGGIWCSPSSVRVQWTGKISIKSVI